MKLRYKKIDINNTPQWAEADVPEYKEVEDIISKQVFEQIEKELRDGGMISAAIAEATISLKNKEIATLEKKVTTLEEKVTTLEEETSSLKKKEADLNTQINNIKDDLYDANGNLIITPEGMSSFTISQTSTDIDTNKFWIDNSTEGDHILKYYNPLEGKWLPVRIAWGTETSIPEDPDNSATGE